MIEESTLITILASIGIVFVGSLLYAWNCGWNAHKAEQARQEMIAEAHLRWQELDP